ncbi:uncharacterized protein LOC124283131 [Haliotis rubra]|uniref:uncharacterized protein LOC124283131 n=1 Tax=Haliotis rubra TaxID=36100 RepID=UPI001EE552FA|nr:uncharacterized protein LOC124283131 [Haliotis rubra]
MNKLQGKKTEPKLPPSTSNKALADSFNNFFLDKVDMIRQKLYDDITVSPDVIKFQSAYRKFHSTETALLRVINDIRRAVDHGNIAALVLLDLSSAFDTIDHNLLDRLRHQYGIDGTALRWISSYIH